jgi:hypothetical protein
MPGWCRAYLPCVVLMCDKSYNPILLDPTQWPCYLKQACGPKWLALGGPGRPEALEERLLLCSQAGSAVLQQEQVRCDIGSTQGALGCKNAFLQGMPQVGHHALWRGCGTQHLQQ